MTRTLGEMTPLERDEVVREALRKLQAEFTRNAYAIAKALFEPIENEAN